jgi:hypothetical protein
MNSKVEQKFAKSSVTAALIPLSMKNGYRHGHKKEEDLFANMVYRVLWGGGSGQQDLFVASGFRLPGI